MKVSAVLVAAGESSRMEGVDKLDIVIDGCTVLERSIRRLLENELIDELVIVTRRARQTELRRLAATIETEKSISVTEGGKTRFLSVQRGIAAASADADYYCIHDAARPFVSDGLITKTIRAAGVNKAATSGVRVSDTIKLIDENGTVTNTPDRAMLRAVGTPQVFQAGLYRAAAAAFAKDEAMDDCEVVENYGHPVVIVEGESSNIKITTLDDIKRMKRREGGMRIGHGYDAHRFCEGRALILGGVRIPFELGLLGHSDADVLTHAVIDSLLGAAALRDIGSLFPDSDPSLKGISSLLLLKEAAEHIKAARYAIINIDSTVICQKPRLSDHIDEMRDRIAEASGLGREAVNVKATTEEGMGFTGEMRGIAAHAVALLDIR
ncbi:MAG: 2-C-methyl-D-erythritol 2,4-cyclodiphosphate synthase [Oscillospiraceae bacterium]|nr:2-C-methyl-D-erythritol 2,4-cyclodiphosphate synthase [Oscillospiraceae bacterium]